jgi:Activator of Hsp90 ATPase homolog 1-like protein
MSELAADVAIRYAMTVAQEVRRAFELFTADMGTWWPAHTGHHLSDVPATAMMETREGGRLWERDELGREFDWGHVRAWEPPGRVVLAWQLDPRWSFDPDPAKATEVEVTFEDDEAGGRTRVSFEHRGFEVHGEPGRQLRDALGAEEGWLEVLRRYEGAAA